MKFLILDGRTVQIHHCGQCMLNKVEAGSEGMYLNKCLYPWLKEPLEWECVEPSMSSIHADCPLSDNRVWNQLITSVKCLYNTIRELYEKYRSWKDGKSD